MNRVSQFVANWIPGAGAKKTKSDSRDFSSLVGGTETDVSQLTYTSPPQPSSSSTGFRVSPPNVPLPVSATERFVRRSSGGSSGSGRTGSLGSANAPDPSEFYHKPLQYPLAPPPAALQQPSSSSGFTVSPPGKTVVSSPPNLPRAPRPPNTFARSTSAPLNALTTPSPPSGSRPAEPVTPLILASTPNTVNTSFSSASTNTVSPPALAQGAAHRFVAQRVQQSPRPSNSEDSLLGPGITDNNVMGSTDSRPSMGTDLEPTSSMASDGPPEMKFKALAIARKYADVKRLAEHYEKHHQHQFDHQHHQQQHPQSTHSYYTPPHHQPAPPNEWGHPTEEGILESPHSEEDQGGHPKGTWEEDVRQSDQQSEPPDFPRSVSASSGYSGGGIALPPTPPERARPSPPYTQSMSTRTTTTTTTTTATTFTELHKSSAFARQQHSPPPIASYVMNPEPVPEPVLSEIHSYPSKTSGGGMIPSGSNVRVASGSGISPKESSEEGGSELPTRSRSSSYNSLQQSSGEGSSRTGSFSLEGPHQGFGGGSQGSRHDDDGEDEALSSDDSIISVDEPLSPRTNRKINIWMDGLDEKTRKKHYPPAFTPRANGVILTADLLAKLPKEEDDEEDAASPVNRLSRPPFRRGGAGPLWRPPPPAAVPPPPPPPQRPPQQYSPPRMPQSAAIPSPPAAPSPPSAENRSSSPRIFRTSSANSSPLVANTSTMAAQFGAHPPRSSPVHPPPDSPTIQQIPTISSSSSGHPNPLQVDYNPMESFNNLLDSPAKTASSGHGSPYGEQSLGTLTDEVRPPTPESIREDDDDDSDDDEEKEQQRKQDYVRLWLWDNYEPPVLTVTPPGEKPSTPKAIDKILDPEGEGDDGGSAVQGLRILKKNWAKRNKPSKSRNENASDTGSTSSRRSCLSKRQFIGRSSERRVVTFDASVVDNAKEGKEKEKEKKSVD